MMDHEDEGDTIPITEWPVTSTEPPLLRKKSRNRVLLVSRSRPHASEAQASGRDLALEPSLRYKCRSRSPIRDSLSNKPTETQSKKEAACGDKDTNEPTCSTSVEEPNHLTEPSAQVRVARWFRKNKDLCKTAQSASVNPNTILFSVSRNKECIDFLKKEKAKLCEKACLPILETDATVHAAIASIDDYLGNYHAALEHISHAIELQTGKWPNKDKEHLWLKEKLQRQCKMIEIQKQKMGLLTTGSHHGIPSMNEVERISAKGLAPEQLWNAYVRQRKPVILVDAVEKIVTEQWNFDYVKSMAGSIKVKVKHSVPNSVEWARLEESRETTVGEFIDEVQRGETDDYLFDWSLPIHCPVLAKELSVPQYFEDNYLLQTSEGSLYHDSWPSLFIAPKGAISNLHIDAFASNFWMVLFQGQKRWTFFDADDTALLYPMYVHTMDPVFSVDISKPDIRTFPLLSLTKPKQCVLQPGELLFVPAGSPHRVENLTATLAVSSNHVDKSNLEQVCGELRINALLDPRAADLLKQLQDPDFATHQEKMCSIKK